MAPDAGLRVADMVDRQWTFHPRRVGQPTREGTGGWKVQWLRHVIRVR